MPVFETRDPEEYRKVKIRELEEKSRVKTMARFSWWNLLAKEFPYNVKPIDTFCNIRVRDALLRALEALDYVVLEAKIKQDPRWFYLITLEYMMLQAIAMCDEELADKIKGKTPEELQDMKYELLTFLRKIPREVSKLCLKPKRR